MSALEKLLRLAAGGQPEGIRAPDGPVPVLLAGWTGAGGSAGATAGRSASGGRRTQPASHGSSPGPRRPITGQSGQSGRPDAHQLHVLHVEHLEHLHRLHVLHEQHMQHLASMGAHAPRGGAPSSGAPHVTFPGPKNW